MRFKHQWSNPPAPAGRMYDESSETETDTYLPVHKQIQAMLITGERLHENKRLYYESILNDYDDSLDGDIQPNYGHDIGDIQDMVQCAQSKTDTVSDEPEPEPKKKSSKKKSPPKDDVEDADEPDSGSPSE